MQSHTTQLNYQKIKYHTRKSIIGDRLYREDIDMLAYEKVSYNDIKDSCSCEDVEFLIELNRKQIARYAEEIKVPVNDVEKQIRLNAPQFEKRIFRNSDFLEKI